MDSWRFFGDQKNKKLLCGVVISGLGRTNGLPEGRSIEDVCCKISKVEISI